MDLLRTRQSAAKSRSRTPKRSAAPAVLFPASSAGSCEIQEQTPSHDERHPQVSGRGDVLMEQKEGGEAGGDDADAAPDGIGGCQIDLLHGPAKEVVAEHISRDAEHGGERLGKAVCKLDHGGRKDFRRDGAEQKHVGHGELLSFTEDLCYTGKRTTGKLQGEGNTMSALSLLAMAAYVICSILVCRHRRRTGGARCGWGKSALMPLLALFVWASLYSPLRFVLTGRKIPANPLPEDAAYLFVIAGLLFGCLGDSLLEIGGKWYGPGAGAFLVGHLCYLHAAG